MSAERRAGLASVGYAALAAAAVGLRIWLIWLAPASYDIQGWEEVAEKLRTSSHVYEDTGRYNIPPAWSWILAGLDRLSLDAGIPFPALVRSLLTVVDVSSAFLLFRIAAARDTIASAWRVAGLFLANPVSIWITAIHGQTDNLSLFFLLAAVYDTERGEAMRSARPVRTGLLLALSLSAKQVSALHPLLWLRRRGGIVTIALAYVGTAVCFLPYAAQWKAIFHRVLLYHSVPRSYGFSEFVLYDARTAVFFGPLAFGAGVTTAWILGRRELMHGCLLLFLVLLFFAPGIGVQYLVWPLTFGVLRAGLGYFLFTGSSLLWIFGSYFGILGYDRWMGHLVWLSVALWAIREIRALQPPVEKGSRTGENSLVNN